eukprot:SAG31_NODE_132_length_23398_cov_14.557620_17_plen_493_part_00
MVQATPVSAAEAGKTDQVTERKWYQVDDGGSVAYRLSSTMEDRSDTEVAEAGEVIEAGAERPEWVQNARNGLWLPRRFLLPTAEPLKTNKAPDVLRVTHGQQRTAGPSILAKNQLSEQPEALQSKSNLEQLKAEVAVLRQRRAQRAEEAPANTKATISSGAAIGSTLARKPSIGQKQPLSAGQNRSLPDSALLNAANASAAVATSSRPKQRAATTLDSSARQKESGNANSFKRGEMSAKKMKGVQRWLDESEQSARRARHQALLSPNYRAPNDKKSVQAKEALTAVAKGQRAAQTTSNNRRKPASSAPKAKSRSVPVAAKVSESVSGAKCALEPEDYSMEPLSNWDGLDSLVSAARQEVKEAETAANSSSANGSLPRTLMADAWRICVTLRPEAAAAAAAAAGLGGGEEVAAMVRPATWAERVAALEEAGASLRSRLLARLKTVKPRPDGGNTVRVDKWSNRQEYNKLIQCTAAVGASVAAQLAERSIHSAV